MSGRREPQDSALARRWGRPEPGTPLHPALRTLALWPLLWLGVHGVPQGSVGIVFKSHPCRRVPLRTCLAKALLGTGAESQLLALAQLDQEGAVLVHVVIGVVISVRGCPWNDRGLLEMRFRDLTCLVLVAPRVEGDRPGSLQLVHRVLAGEGLNPGLGAMTS